VRERIKREMGRRDAPSSEDLSGALASLGEDRTPANVLLRELLSAAVVDWRTGALFPQWKHGGESELQYGWPADA
jgi:hypothetical protein